MAEYYIWFGILVCSLNAAVFSGLNLAYFRLSDLQLKIMAQSGNQDAQKVMKLREQPHFLLATILWVNVAYNVLLTLLTSSVMTGISSFVFSTFVLTIVGEIMPQATFSRRAIKVGAFFYPMIKFYQILLYPFSKGTALILNFFLGPDKPFFYSEEDLISLIREHMIQKEAKDLSFQEGEGAINFLLLDDRFVRDTGASISAKQIIEIPGKKGSLGKLKFVPHREDPFVHKVLKANSKYVVLVGESGDPAYVLNTEKFAKGIFEFSNNVKIRNYCYKPLIIKNPKSQLESVLMYFSNNPQTKVLYWTKKEKRLVSRRDLFGVLMQD